MFATFANLGLLMLLMCLGCVIAGGVTLIIVLWSIDKEAQRDLRLLSEQLPQARLIGDYRVKSGMRFENGKYVLVQRVSSDALREVFYKLKGG